MLFPCSAVQQSVQELLSYVSVLSSVSRLLTTLSFSARGEPKQWNDEVIVQDAEEKESNGGGDISKLWVAQKTLVGL